MTYVRKLTNLLDILLEDEDVDIYDGELVSEASQHMGILREEQDDGRKIDIMAKPRYNNVRLELYSIEFKVQGADDIIFMHQQSKNIQTNICILNKINNITKKSKSILYMGWKGREGYLALLHQHNDIVICQYVDTLYIPKNLIKLDSFKKTLEKLWMWKDKIIKLNNESKLAAHFEENKYIVAEIGSPHIVTRSPPRSPSQSPLIIPFSTPAKKKNTKSNGRFIIVYVFNYSLSRDDFLDTHLDKIY